MDKAPKLTASQSQLLDLIPDPPSDGRRIRGPQKRTAESLQSKGLVRHVGHNQHSGADYYVRTPSGSAMAMCWFDLAGQLLQRAGYQQGQIFERPGPLPSRAQHGLVVATRLIPGVPPSQREHIAAAVARDAKGNLEVVSDQRLDALVTPMPHGDWR